MVYIIEDNKYCKIGVSECPDARLKELQTGNPNRLKIIKTIRFCKRKAFDYWIEKALHKEYAAYQQRIDGTPTEWFSRKGINELANADEYKIANILSKYSIAILPSEIEIYNLFNPKTEHDIKVLFEKGYINSQTVQALIRGGYETLEKLIHFYPNSEDRVKGIGPERDKMIRNAIDKAKEEYIK